MALRWRSSFSCNIQEIDNQHKKLFEISSKFHILIPICSKIDCKDEIAIVLKELEEYAIYHFDYEEKLLQKYDYPDFHVHHLNHQVFVHQVRAFQNVEQNLDKSETVMKILDFISDWITSHILGTDMQYKDYLNKNGVY